MAEKNKFQFHKGAIRTDARQPEALPCCYFNSIKVRLELSINEAAEMVAKFQFHKGAIRTEESATACVPSRYFNSIKVRLELSQGVKVLFGVLIFQFHKGAIRTR